MDYRKEEVILRASIERILKRRLLFGGTGKTIAEPLVRELVWARYFPDESIPESITERIQGQIDLYLELRRDIVAKHILPEKEINQWIYHLMSSDVQHILNPDKKRESMANFMFQVMRTHVKIADDTEQVRDAQVFIAVRKNFTKDDLAFLRFHLFNQYFGRLTEENIKHVSAHFMEGYNEIQSQLNYPRRDTIYNYVKKKTAVFLIFEDLLTSQKGNIRELYKTPEELKKAVFDICNFRYKGISSKIRTAIIRSVVFILLTKAVFAIGVEGTYENLVYGEILWPSIILNIAIPPLLMIIASITIRPPGKQNSEYIYMYIHEILSNDNPNIGIHLITRKSPPKMKPVLNIIFTTFWFLTFILMFGSIIYILTKLNFNIMSQIVFMFFFAIISFLSYRISQAANAYDIEYRKSPTAPIKDFLFMPFIQVGRKLTEGISQVNIFLYILDFVIETPFKGMFAFFEQWFFFLQSKREKLE